MDDNGEDLAPFWLQNTTDLPRADRVRHRLSSLFFNSALLLIILLVTAVFFLVFIVPSSFSFTNVKKSWDSVNLVLVLAAVIFGFLSRNKNEDQITSPVNRNEVRKSNPSTPSNRWFSDSPNGVRTQNPTTPRTWYDNADRNSYRNSTGGGLRRTFSSYPDLSEVSPRWITAEDHWRFYDDTYVETRNPDQLYRRRSWRDQIDRSPEPDVKTVYEYPFVPLPAPPSLPPAPVSPPPAQVSPPPAQPPVNEEKVKRATHSVRRKRERPSKRRDNHEPEKGGGVHKASQIHAEYMEGSHPQDNHEREDSKVVMAAATPPPLPPPPLPEYVEPKSSKSDKKRGGASATKEFLNSFYHKKKRKNRSKSVENFDALLHKSEPPPLRYEWAAAASYAPPPTPPPPPPPPPPPSLFQNLFTSKKARKKKNVPVISTPGSPPPPPPPPPRRISRPNTQTSSMTRTPAQRHNQDLNVTRAPKPLKVRSFNSVEENSNSGGESPLMSIPPPPPPPPPEFFRKHAWKFVVQGDYVRIDSTVSSRSGSPEPEDTVYSTDTTPTAAEHVGGDRAAFAPSPLFCPSPDVNTKAENFISNFRAGLKLEKINSFKKQEGLGLSNLGPRVGPI